MTVTPSTSEIAEVAAPALAAPMRRHRGFLRQALGLRRTQVGLVAVGLLVLVAVLGPVLAPHSPTEFVDAPFNATSDVATFGTDNLGRDVLSRFLYGGRTILAIAFLGTILGIASGTALGLLAGYSTRIADDVVMRLADLLLAFPGIVLALLLITVSGPHNWVLVGVVGLGIMPHTARIVRSSTMQVRDSDFVRYAEGTGTPTRRILASEILPNISAPLTVEFGLRLTQSIGTIAGLDYLGLGSGPPTADWGLMIQENQNGLTIAPMSVLLPIVAIAVLTVGSNLITDGIAQAAAGVNRAVEG